MKWIDLRLDHRKLLLGTKLGAVSRAESGKLYHGRRQPAGVGTRTQPRVPCQRMFDELKALGLVVEDERGPRVTDAGEAVLATRPML